MDDELSGPSSRSIDAAKRGDDKARDSIARHVGDYADRTVPRNLPERSDVVQEIVQAADRGLMGDTQFENRRSFWGWVAVVRQRIVATTLRNKLRRRRPQVSLSDVGDDGVPSSGSATPSKVAQLNELAAWAQQAVAALSEDDLRIWQSRIDYAHIDDLVDKLQIAEGSIRRRYSRIRDRLRLGFKDLIQLDMLQRRGVVDLPPNYRQAYIWSRITGLTHAEIGQRLGISENAVSHILARVQTWLSVNEESAT